MPIVIIIVLLCDIISSLNSKMVDCMQVLFFGRLIFSDFESEISGNVSKLLVTRGF